MGDAGCFSFYPGKNLGAYGEAGAVVTNNATLAEKVRGLRDHGQLKKNYHTQIGWNGRMDGFQGAILSVKLKHLPIWNESRRRNAQIYNQLLADVDNVTIPYEADYGTHVYHLYAIRTQKRELLRKALSEKDIHCGIHYPVPVHLTEAYKFLGYKKGSFPLSETCAEGFLTKEQIETVVNNVTTLLSQMN
jgi:dTDP-4-amino-4,6-dideoxygalactose transaminase